MSRRTHITMREKINRYGNYIKLLLPFVRGNWMSISCSLVALLGVILCEMGIPVIIKTVMDGITSETVRADGALSLLRKTAILYFSLICGTLLFSYLQNYLMQYSGQHIMLRLRKGLFNFLMRQSLQFYHHRPIGTIISRMGSDVEGLQQLFSTILTGLIRSIATMIAIIITMALLNIPLTLLTFLTLPLIIPCALFFSIRLRAISHKVRQAFGALTSFISEHISGMEIIHIFSSQKQDGKLFKVKNNNHYSMMRKEVYTLAIFRPLVDLLTALSTAYLFLVSVRLQEQQLVTVGVTVAFLNLITRFFQQLSSIADNFLNIQNARTGIERVFSLQSEANELPQATLDKNITITDGAVKFRKVLFGYKNDQTIIHGIDFNIKPRTTVALVGYTGSGKSTIANLLTRLWDIQGGAITIDGHDVKKIPNEILRQEIAIISQKISLFDDTLINNIRMGADLSDHEIIAAARIAQADSFIKKMPQGYDTRLRGDEGSMLSVGQKQLIAFARVIAHNPKILVLDEATAGIDSHTEQLIQQAMHPLLKNRSALVIAHRLSTIQNADEILALSDGKIIERGTHAQLLQKREYYYNLWKYQLRN